MSDSNMKNFSKRVGRIDKRHDQLAGGYVASVNHDGLIVARVRRRSGPRFPWKGVALCFVAFFAFKAFLLVQLGEATFNERVGKLQEGTVVEKVGAYAMSADPLTSWIASQIRSVLP
ncbi:MAG: hypothetical protein KAT26_08520 [Marinosulfonomonas sp.]|nr:hypothetical protein [Marinosulfonomonas sp.]